MKEYLKLLKWNRWEAVLPAFTRKCSKFGFLGDAREASKPVWVSLAVVPLRDSNKMPLNIPS